MARDTAKDLQRLLHEHPDLIETWVTQKGEWVGLAMTEDEAYTLIALLEPVLAPEADDG